MYDVSLQGSPFSGIESGNEKGGGTESEVRELLS